MTSIKKGYKLTEEQRKRVSEGAKLGWVRRKAKEGVKYKWMK